jgi:hypothetical protein
LGHRRGRRGVKLFAEECIICQQGIPKGDVLRREWRIRRGLVGAAVKGLPEGDIVAGDSRCGRQQPVVAARRQAFREKRGRDSDPHRGDGDRHGPHIETGQPRPAHDGGCARPAPNGNSIGRAVDTMEGHGIQRDKRRNHSRRRQRQRQGKCLPLLGSASTGNRKGQSQPSGCVEKTGAGNCVLLPCSAVPLQPGIAADGKEAGISGAVGRLLGLGGRRATKSGQETCAEDAPRGGKGLSRVGLHGRRSL